jgi:hypothetical protein
MNGHFTGQFHRIRLGNLLTQTKPVGIANFLRLACLVSKSVSDMLSCTPFLVVPTRRANI